MDNETLDVGATRKTFKCDQCKEGFASMVGLKNHVKSDHKKAKELPKMHKGRTTLVTIIICKACNTTVASLH